MTLHEEQDAELIAERHSYLRELKSKLQETEALILDLSGADGKAEHTQPLARQIHTIKGTSGSLGLDLLATAAHRMEDLFVKQQREQENSEKFVDRLLAQNDLLTTIAAAYLDGDERSLGEMRRRFDIEASTSAGAQNETRFSRVLIIETSVVTLQFCGKILKELGAIHMTSVQDGYEALGLLLKDKFDAVLTSLHVPTIDGHSLATLLRTIPGPNAATPVILLTSAAATLDPAKPRPDYVVEKNLGLANELREILKQLAGSSLQERPASDESKVRTLSKILLVDDSREIHTLVRLSFKRFPDVQIVGLLDPRTAVESARRLMPDLILLDVQMSPLSGKEVMQAIKATPEICEIPVAFFTGTDDAEEIKELRSLGACQIFKKPFSPKTFSDQVIASYRAL